MQEVINGIIEAILLLDNIINAWIVEIRHPLLTKIMASVTGLGSATACFAFLGVFYLAGWTEEWRAAGTGLLLTGITVASLMMAVQRSFPRSPVCLVKGNEMVAHSFPSGQRLNQRGFHFFQWSHWQPSFAFHVFIWVRTTFLTLLVEYLLESVVGWLDAGSLVIPRSQLISAVWIQQIINYSKRNVSRFFGANVRRLYS